MDLRLVLDIGGTFIKYALADNAGAIIKGTEGEEPTHSDGTCAQFFGAIENIIKRERDKEYAFHTACVCIPGPFDYTSGIPMMDHKFVQMKGQSLTPVFQSEGITPLYIHDSTAFLLGELYDGAMQGISCCSGIMLGTGFGFTMAKEGKICIRKDERPALSLWSRPLHDGIVEDYISRRAMRATYQKRSKNHEDIDVKEIGFRADYGDRIAQQLFIEVGENIAKVLKQYVPEEERQHVVLGGQIARSGNFIIPPIKAEGIDAVEAMHIDDAALRGNATCLIKGKTNVTQFTDEEGQRI